MYIGTNDLTQMTFGFSRDDVGTFLPVYLKNNLLEDDPFEGKLIYLYTCVPSIPCRKYS